MNTDTPRALAPPAKHWSYRLASNPLALTVAFNAFWLLCVWGQQGIWAVAVLILVGLVLRDSLGFALRWAWVGIGIDFVLYRAGVHQFEGALFPLWLLALWFGLCLYLHRMGPALAKLHLGLLVPGGALSGALSYWAGLRLGAVQWPHGVEATLVLLFVLWLLISLGIGLLCRHYWPKETV